MKEITKKVRGKEVIEEVRKKVRPSSAMKMLMISLHFPLPFFESSPLEENFHSFLLSETSSTALVNCKQWQYGKQILVWLFSRKITDRKRERDGINLIDVGERNLWGREWWNMLNGHFIPGATFSNFFFHASQKIVQIVNTNHCVCIAGYFWSSSFFLLSFFAFLFISFLFAFLSSFLSFLISSFLLIVSLTP